MDTYSFFKDFSAPLATAAAAVSAAFVTGLFAYRQARTADLQARIALDRLKYDTFEHRHDVLDACRDLMKLYSEKTPTLIVDAAEIGECTLRIAKGKFYFGSAVNGELVAYVTTAADLAALQFLAHHSPKHSTQRAELEERAVAGVRLLRQRLMSVQASLEYDLSLNLLKEGSERDSGRGRSSLSTPEPTATPPISN